MAAKKKSGRTKAKSRSAAVKGLQTIGDLRAALADSKATWVTEGRLGEDDHIPVHALGGKPEGLPVARTLAKLNLKAELANAPVNPFTLQRRLALGIGPAKTKHLSMHPGAGFADASPVPATPLPPAGGTRSAAVDWRNRWGWAWVTTTQNQGSCGSCWAFAAAALLETMVRIEHAVWSKRSEGDVHDGMGKRCADAFNLGDVFDWIKTNGLADPDCYPYKTDNSAYTPTPDRSGRTVKIADYRWIGDIEQQKVWIDCVGPIATWFNVYTDFDGYAGAVYHRIPTATERGGHFLLVVGYDDAQKCWIVKNSWGTAWGETDWRGQRGYARIGYGEAGIDQYAKLGVCYTNPDPWTKRRLHNGNMIESGNGPWHRNFEMLATANGNQLRHWWRDNSANGFPWHQGVTFGTDAAACPTLTSTTYNRNFESVHLTTTSRLRHWFFDQSAGQWKDGGVFGPTDAAGMPGFIQGNYSAPGNFEVVVRTRDGRLNHWYRINAQPWTWLDGGRFGSGIMLSGPSLIQSHYGRRGNLELVAVRNDGRMQLFWRDNDNGNVWRAGDVFGSGVASPPVLIEGQFGTRNENAVGNFELCVAVGGRAQHWWRDNQGNTGWHMSAAFGHDILAIAALVEGSFGFNFEVIVLRNDRRLQHYWRDGGGWHEGVIIGSAA